MIVSLLFLTSCSSRPDGMHVILFSDMQAGVQKNIKEAAEQKAGKVDIFPAFPEKLLTEITAHEGDVFIVPEDMFQAYDDPENFQPLDGLRLEKTSPYTTVNKKNRRKNGLRRSDRKRGKTAKRLFFSIESQYGGVYPCVR